VSEDLNWICVTVGSMDRVHSETRSGSMRTHRFMTNWRYCDETVEINEQGRVGKLLSRKPSNRTSGSNSSPLSKWRLYVSLFVPASKSAGNTFSQLTLPLSLFFASNLLKRRMRWLSIDTV
jgi:hypothetical protein